MKELILKIVDVANNNSGALSLALFVLTLLFGWVSGIFKALSKKPKLNIDMIATCTFYAINRLEKTFNALPVFHFAFVIYLDVTNVGYAPTTIKRIRLRYLRNDLNKKKKAGKNWIDATINKGFFYNRLDEENLHVFPTLIQRNVDGNKSDLFLEVGKSTNGVVYFEEKETYGNFVPRPNKDGTTDVLIEITDAYGKKFIKHMTVKEIDYSKALARNEFFAQTF